MKRRKPMLPVQQTMKVRRWHLLNLAEYTHIVCHLAVAIQQIAYGKLIPV